MWAAELGYSAIVTALLDNNAEVTLQNNVRIIGHVYACLYIVIRIRTLSECLLCRLDRVR